MTHVAIRDPHRPSGRALFPDVSPVDLRTGLATTVDWFRTL